MSAETVQTIDPVALFAFPGCGCDCDCCGGSEMPTLWTVTVDGVQYVTDSYVLLVREYLPRVEVLADLLEITIPATLRTITVGLAHTVTSQSPSERIFQSRFLDALEGANLRVRPTTHESMHAILNIAGRRVGNLMPYKTEPLDGSTVPVRRAS